jgi:cyclopropane-fatty-acyl-phospholipid synthase
VKLRLSGSAVHGSAKGPVAMFGPLKYVFDRVVRKGSLLVRDSGGAAHTFGDGSPPHVAVHIQDWRLEKELTLNPQLALGEGYLSGRFRVEVGSIYDFLELMLSNAVRRPFPRWMSHVETLRRATKRFQQYNPVSRSRANVAHHYDIDRRIYDLFLDSDRQYSCAYFTGHESLEEAQVAKKRHLAAKLALAPGQKVLDIGSGWGGLALYLAQTSQCTITGITLSTEQLAIANERALQAGLSNQVQFKLEDYRHLQGKFDRIVSVGMFEHVGVNHYDTYFQCVHDLLDDDGVAVIHSIGRSDEPAVTNQFIARHIFPGGYIPALSEVLPAIERSGLILTDVEILRLHYAKTLRSWRERFVTHWDEVKAIKGEDFCRMWEFYLAASETAFRYQSLMVFQLQLTKRVDALPSTRDYMWAEERRLYTLETAGAEQQRTAGA